MDYLHEEISVIKDACSILDKELADELADQGHRLTGALEASIKGTVVATGNAVIGSTTMLNYGKYVENGVPASSIPFSQGSGAKSSKYIDGLTRFFILRGLSPKEAKSAAFATAKKQKKEGMPTQNSYSFSHNGFRTKFIENSESAARKNLDTVVKTGIDNIVLTEFHQTKSETI
jgi:hypothetical protein